MKIAIAGPYSAPTGKERQQNLDALNEAAAAIYEMGHIPVVGVNAALPVLEKSETEDEYQLITDIAVAITQDCDALLLLAASADAAPELESMESQGKPVFKSIGEIPA
ncbi:MAG: hypothetical protein K1X61_04970 [Chitinophagales bacterium]|nr:hypothetical protein [Chitinophagales bacterium]